MRSSKPKKNLDEEGLYQYAVRALASRMRSVAEIKRLMRRRVAGDDTEATINAVVARLKAQSYLNDEFYAATYSTYRRDNQKLGKLRVINDLKARGVHGDVIKEAVSTAYDDTDDEAQAREFLRRKRVAKPADEKHVGRVFRMLMRAGFSTKSISRILKNWNVDDETITALETEAESGSE